VCSSDLVKAECKKGLSRKNAERKADAQFGSVKEWVASERLEGRSGNIYGGSPPSPSSSVTTSPRSNALTNRPGSPYSLNSNNRKSRRINSRRSSSKKSKKSKKT
jgi:hypothetical protein